MCRRTVESLPPLKLNDRLEALHQAQTLLNIARQTDRHGKVHNMAVILVSAPIQVDRALHSCDCPLAFVAQVHIMHAVDGL